MRVPSASISPPPATMTAGMNVNFLTGICKLSDRLVMLLDLNKIMNANEIAQIGTNVAPVTA